MNEVYDDDRQQDKIILGKLLDKLRVKSISYTEKTKEAKESEGIYLIVYANDKDELVEDTITGVELD